MGDISRDSDLIEIEGPPRFDYGQKVKSKRMIRNDGTFPGKEIGEVLVSKGDFGYVANIGTFLQQFYIYGIYFYEKGFTVGCKSRELELAELDEGENDISGQ